MRKLFASVAIALMAFTSVASAKTSHVIDWGWSSTPGSPVKSFWFQDDDQVTYEVDSIFPQYADPVTGSNVNVMFDYALASVIDAKNNGWLVDFYWGYFGAGVYNSSIVYWLQSHNTH